LIMNRRIASIAWLLTAWAIVPHADGTATLVVPGRANANVSIASHGDLVAAVWAASTPRGATDVYAATSRNGGETFSAPVRVNSVAGDARVNGEQPPRLALTPQTGALPGITVVWTAKGSAGTKLLTARSVDGGRTFGRARLVPGTDAAGNRGWEAVHAAPGGRVYAAWLDHRRLAAQDAAVATDHRHEGRHKMPASATSDGVAMAQLSDLFVAELGGGAAPNVATSGVCYCCKTAIASGPSGALYVAWRHVYPGNLRDIAFAVSRDGGRTFSQPVRVSEDRWEISGCPDDGPAMAVESTGRIHVVWPTVVVENGETVKALFHAMSDDGVTFSTRTRLPTTGQANHPQIASTGRAALTVAWDESGDGSRRVAFAHGAAEPSGAVTFRRVGSGGERAGIYPALAHVQDHTLLAWTTGDPETSAIRVEMVRR
jgi:hypothetical protein